MNEQDYEDLKDEVEKVFEDDKVLIVKPLTYLANKYYGAKSPWFEDGWYGMKEFEKRLDSGGKIYYVVNKETGEKDSFYKDRYGQVWYNENSQMGEDEINSLIEFAPSAKKAILEITGKDIFRKLRQFAKGQLDDATLEHSDDLIHDIKVNKKSLGDSQVILRFDDDDKFFELLDLGDNDIWFINAVWARDFEFRNGDQMWEDNKEGYGIFRYFNDENLEKLKKIAQIVMPSEEFQPQNDQYMGKLYMTLYETFERQLDRMDWEFLDEINTASSQHARESIEKEFNEYLNRKGFQLVRNFDAISTTIADLIYLYSIKGMKNADLKTLLSKELEPGPREHFGGWGDDYYEYESSNNMDLEKLNESFSKELDEIIEWLEDNNDFKDYFELSERILSKYKLNVWYETPKDKNILFRIKKIDPKTLKLEVSLRHKQKKMSEKQHSFSEENFNKFIHQPELFSIFERY